MTIPYTSNFGQVGYGLVRPGVPVVDLPPGASVARIRSRPDDFIIVYLRTGSGIERWYVNYATPEHSALRLLYPVARNERPGASLATSIAPL